MTRREDRREALQVMGVCLAAAALGWVIRGTLGDLVMALSGMVGCVSLIVFTACCMGLVSDWLWYGRSRDDD